MRRPSWRAARNVAAASRVAANRNAAPISSAMVITSALADRWVARGMPVAMARPRSGPWDLHIEATATGAEYGTTYRHPCRRGGMQRTLSRRRRQSAVLVQRTTELAAAGTRVAIRISTPLEKRRSQRWGGLA